jgi:hypothetical protein
MKPEPKQMSALAWAILHHIAGGETNDLGRLVAYIRDPEDVDQGERWQFLRLAERDAWTAVELLLLRRTIEKRFSDGLLDAWVQTTPLGAEIREGLAEFFDSYRTIEFPRKPRKFGEFAFQELCAARLAGELDAELRDPAGSGQEVMERLATSLAGRYPLFTQAIRNPTLDVPGIGWGVLDWRIRCNFETLVALPTERTPPPNPGLEDLTVLLVNIPSTVTKLICDVFADGELVRRLKQAEVRRRLQLSADAGGGTADVPSIVDRVIPIRATTLAEAVTAAEQIRRTENTIVALRALWEWYFALPLDQRKEIGEFKDKRDLWVTARLRHRLRNG